MNHPEDPFLLRFSIVLAVLAVMLALETFRPERSWRVPRLKRFFTNGSIALFDGVLMRFLILGPLFFLVRFTEQNQGGLTGALGLRGIPEILATVVLFDCLEYWLHRFYHRVPFLWRFHKPHHTDTHLDVTTALRFHPFELMISYPMKAVWILLWGPSLAAFAVYETALIAFAQFHHSNIALPRGAEKIVRLVHITPRIHTSHHTVTPRSRDGNFCVIFSVWDRLFGTYREPDDEEMKSLGLEDGRRSDLSLRAFFKAPLEAPHETKR